METQKVLIKEAIKNQREIVELKKTSKMKTYWMGK